MAKNGQVSELLKSLQEAGYTVVRTKNNHWKIQSPGKNPVIIAHSPSDKRGVPNAISTLSRHGYTFSFGNRSYNTGG